MMKMFVAIVLFVAFALPASSQDVITLTAYEDLLKSGASTHGMTKTVISNPLLEEVLVSYSNHKLGGLPTCGETCFVSRKCSNKKCKCNTSYGVCFMNSLEDTDSAAASQDVITLTAYEELLKSGASTDGMTKTVISNPLLEEALVSYSNNKLGGLPTCGETCFVSRKCSNKKCKCNTSYGVCFMNSLDMED